MTEPIDTPTAPPSTWAAWLQAELDRLGWRQADLVRESNELIKRDRVSKWLKGDEVPTHRNVILVANVLQAPRREALVAAGFSELAEHVPDETERPFPNDAPNTRVRAFDIASVGLRAIYEKRRAVLADFTDTDLLNELIVRAEERAG